MRHLLSRHFRFVSINKVLERFNMKNFSPSVAPILKGDILDLN